MVFCHCSPSSKYGLLPSPFVNPFSQFASGFSGINEAAIIRQPEHLTSKSTIKTMEVMPAPVVVTKYDVAGARHVDVTAGMYYSGQEN